MGLFSRNRAPARTPVRTGARDVGSGRDLTSDLPVGSVLTILDDLARGYSTKSHAFMPALLPARCDWTGEGPAPEVTVAFDDAAGDLVVAGFWPHGSGTRAALFPTTTRDDRLTTAVVGNWKMRDGSLRSVGTWPGNSLHLRAPVVDHTVLEATLARAGVAVNDANLARLEYEFSRMAAVKAHQFIASRDQGAARRFADDHHEASPAAVLEDLASWNPAVLPHVQDLPFRIASILLERDGGGNLGAAVWKHMTP